MHELSISRSIATTVERHAAGRPVACVRLDVGHLRQIVPDTLVHCWGMVVEGTELEGARLEVNQIPVTIECRLCGARRALDEPVFRCEACASTEVTIVTGEEFLITSFDLAGV